METQIKVEVRDQTETPRKKERPIEEPRREAEDVATKAAKSVDMEDDVDKSQY